MAGTELPSDVLTALSLRFQITGELGRGGMGAVLKGHDRELGREVAIKLLPASISRVLGADQFAQEIRLTARPALFHTGWFVESLFTQTLIIHVIRTNKIPFLQSRASWPLMVASVVIPAIGLWLTVSPLAPVLGFVGLPALYWLLLAGMLLGYMVLTQGVKSWFYRRYGD